MGQPDPRCCLDRTLLRRHTIRIPAPLGTDWHDMRFAAFMPPQAATRKLPVVWFLAGLTCTEENFTVKAGAQRTAAELGLILIAPDTSPRGEGVPDDPDGA